jgi:uncharacterized membrane protein (UPF0127 family)
MAIRVGAWPRIAALAAFVCLSPIEAPAHADDASTVAGTPQKLAAVPLTIVSHGTSHRFRIEVARSAEQQEMGLMFRRHLDPGGGMIFPRIPPDRATFWMKNTLIPLDIVFIRTDGTVARVAAMATPLSLDLIDAGEEVGAVLELAGGRAAQLGITAGDTVHWKG